jgi:hypothetical protein
MGNTRQTKKIYELIYKERTVELGYNIMKGSEYFALFLTSVVITEWYNVTANSEELIGTTEYLTL